MGMNGQIEIRGIWIVRWIGQVDMSRLEGGRRCRLHQMVDCCTFTNLMQLKKEFDGISNKRRFLFGQIILQQTID